MTHQPGSTDHPDYQGHTAPQGGPAAPGTWGSAPGRPAPTSGTEHQLVAAAHWSPIAAVLLGGMTWMGPLVVLLLNGGRSRRVTEHCYDALNFQITVWLATLAVVVLSIPLMILLVGFVTIWLAALIPLAALVVHGVAAVRTAGGEPYAYPFTYRFLR